MLFNLTYPVVLNGLPAGHRREKRCLLARTVSHEIADVAGSDAPLVMSYRHSEAAPVLERRAFGGKLYSPLGIAAARLPELTRAVAFRVDDPVVGEMAFEAARAFLALHFGVPQMKPLPEGIGMSDNRLILEPDVEQKIFRLSENFTVSESDRHRDLAAERHARDLLDRYLVVDGMAWVRDEELVYYARPPSDAGKGFVTVTSARLYDLSLHPRDKYWFEMWGDPSAMVFNASSVDAVAEFSGREATSYAAVSVFDETYVSPDIDALELERCARLVDRHSEKLARHEFVADVLPPLRRALANPPSPERLDTICDLLAEISAGLKAEGGRSRAAIGRDHIDRFVERYTSRPVAAVDIPAFRPDAA